MGEYQMNDLKILALQEWHYPLLLGVFVTLFVTLSLFTQNGYTLRLDQSVLTWFHHIRTPFLDNYFSNVTWLGSLWILIPLFVVYMIVYGTSHPVMAKTFTILFWGSVITTYALKYLLERKRPHFFAPYGELPLDPSFPSAHSAQIAAFTIALGISFYTSSSPYNSAVFTLLGIIAFSVFASRMYLQVHFPTDILGGIIIALAWATLAVWIIQAGGNR